MRKKELSNFALIGLTTGLLISCQEGIGGSNGSKGDDQKKNGNGDHKNGSADDQKVLDRLNAWGKKNFDEMSPEQKAMVVKIADQGCKGRNACKGQGGCKTEKNICSGRNDCKGQGGCKVSANKAVEVVKRQMQDKRQNM